MHELFPEWEHNQALREAILTDFLLNSLQLPGEALRRRNTTVVPYIVTTGHELANFLLSGQAEAALGKHKLLTDCSPYTISAAKWGAFSIRRFTQTGATTPTTVLACKLWHESKHTVNNYSQSKGILEHINELLHPEKVSALIKTLRNPSFTTN